MHESAWDMRPRELHMARALRRGGERSCIGTEKPAVRRDRGFLPGKVPAQNGAGGDDSYPNIIAVSQFYESERACDVLRTL